MKTNKRDEALETLNGMTKAEIICWLSSEVGMLFRPPRKSELLARRHQAASDAAWERRIRNVLGVGVADKIDALTVKLNVSKSHKEYMDVFAQLEPYRQKWNAWIKEIKLIDVEERKVNAMWDEYMKQAEREQSHPQ